MIAVPGNVLQDPSAVERVSLVVKGGRVVKQDLEILSRPVTYLTWDARAVDGKRHKVVVYDDALQIALRPV